MIKKSVLFFWIISLLYISLGIMYIVLPIAPYHQDIIGMTSGELAAGYPVLNNLITALVNVIGIAFITIGICQIYYGYRAWKDKTAWLIMLCFVAVLNIPLFFIVYTVGGPYWGAVLLFLLQAAGIAISGTIEKQWN